MSLANKTRLKVVQVLDSLLSNAPHEDDFVELKGQWPYETPANKAKEYKFIRQVAGHANAARGEDILWIIGADKQRGVVGATDAELSQWHNEFKSSFDGTPPALLLSECVHYNAKTVVALLFETVRAPYVVLNPQFRQPGVLIKSEVPFRTATGTDSAKQPDFARMLMPLMHLPEVEVFRAELHEGLTRQAAQQAVQFTMDLHVVPRNGKCILLLHRSRVRLFANHPGVGSLTAAMNVNITHGSTSRGADSGLIMGSSHVVVNDAGLVMVASYNDRSFDQWRNMAINATVAIGVAFCDRPIIANLVLAPSYGTDESGARIQGNHWKWTPSLREYLPD